MSSLARVLRTGTLLEQGKALMLRFAPTVKLDARQLGGRRAGAWYAPATNEIKWPLADGLTVLLHEIGHYKKKHVRLECCDGKMLMEEIEAWLWAEHAAKTLGIEFDYKSAEHYFGRKKYNRFRVGLQWRHRADHATPKQV